MKNAKKNKNKKNNTKKQCKKTKEKTTIKNYECLIIFEKNVQINVHTYPTFLNVILSFLFPIKKKRNVICGDF